jgi:hypothetical protein
MSTPENVNVPGIKLSGSDLIIILLTLNTPKALMKVLTPSMLVVTPFYPFRSPNLLY